MQVEVKTHSGISLEPIETRLLAQRIIVLDRDINSEVALSIVKQLIILSENKDEPIKLLIHSVGGEINAGMMIIDAMKSLHVHTYCLGQAFSMAAIIFTAGEIGHRYMLDSASLMLHEPRILDRTGGTVTSIKQLSQDLQKIKEKIIKVLASNTKLPLEVCNKLVTDDDLFLDAQESINNKLCDGIAAVSDLW